MRIADDQRLVRVVNQFGRELPIYDDGFGPLWVHRDSMGISGIVRARTWEDAYGICEDEFFSSCDLTREELVKEYGFRRRHAKIVREASGVEREAVESDYPFDKSGVVFVRWDTIETADPEAWPENELFQEAYGFRPNGRGGPTPDKDFGIYCKDLNGESLEPLTEKLCADLGLKVELASE